MVKSHKMSLAVEKKKISETKHILEHFNLKAAAQLCQPMGCTSKGLARGSMQSKWLYLLR